MPEFSIIIPFQRANDYLRETLEHVGRLLDASFEVILLPDQDMDSTAELGEHAFPIVVIHSGPVSPAIKRDMGASASRGTLLAFIDDDAYPKPDWLKQAGKHFADPTVAAVGGPQVTPRSDGFWQQVSGATFLSPLNGSAVCRYWPSDRSWCVDDWPSVNLVVRKEDFLRVGGFDSEFWPGEDTKLCLDLAKTLGKKIMYEPAAVVFHHRRSGFLRHMKQIGNYGLHRGYFAKRLPETSLRLSYFIPSAFFLFVVFGWTVFFLGGAPARLYLWLWAIYLVALAFSTAGIWAKVGRAYVAFATIPYLVGTHVWYGWRFIKGFLLTRDLHSRLGR